MKSQSKGVIKEYKLTFHFQQERVFKIKGPSALLLLSLFRAWLLALMVFDVDTDSSDHLLKIVYKELLLIDLLKVDIEDFTFSRQNK